MACWLVCVGDQAAAPMSEDGPPLAFYTFEYIKKKKTKKKNKRQHIDSRPPRLMKNSSGRLAAAPNIRLPFNHGTSHPACLASRRRSQRHVTPAARHTCVYIGRFLKRFPRDVLSVWPDWKASCSLWRAARTALPLFGFSSQGALMLQPEAVVKKKKKAPQKTASVQRIHDVLWMTN